MKLVQEEIKEFMSRRGKEAWAVVSHQKNKVPLTSLYPAFNGSSGSDGTLQADLFSIDRILLAHSFLLAQEPQ